jgi:phage-related protein
MLTYSTSASAKPPLKPLQWVGGSRRSLQGMPEAVKDAFGSALLDVQYGDRPPAARPFGEGLPREIWKIAEDFDGNTYRAVYTAAFPGVVYVLDAFVKKSKSGIGTPNVDKQRVHRRLDAAKQHYNTTYAHRAR